MGDFLLKSRCDSMSVVSTVKQKIKRKTQQVRFFKLYFDFNVFSVENRRLFPIEFQLHTNCGRNVFTKLPSRRGSKAMYS